MTKKASTFGSALLEGLKEAVGWKRGTLALDTVRVDPMPVIEANPKFVAKVARD